MPEPVLAPCSAYSSSYAVEASSGASAAFSTSLDFAEPGSTSASERSSGSATPSVRAFTCTSSTSPTNIGSVPGRASARLLAAGVGPVLVVVLQVLPRAPVVTGAGAHLHGDLVLVELLAVLPRDTDRREPRDGLRRAGDAGVGGATGDGAAAEPGEATGGAGQRHLGHLRGHRLRGHGRRHQLGRQRLAAGRAGGLLAGVGADDVERDHTGGGREDDEHDTQGQHLLAEGDETGLKRSHERSTPVWGKVTQGRSFTPVTPVTEGFLSNYTRVISTRHAVTWV